MRAKGKFRRIAAVNASPLALHRRDEVAVDGDPSKDIGALAYVRLATNGGARVAL